MKSGYRAKWESGKFLASYDVYGYRKSNEDRYKLVVDDVTAPIVKRIFAMALDGIKPAQIALTLNTDKVQTPLEYLVKKQNVRSWSKLKPMWTGTEIIRILRDLRYTGAMTNGMYSVDKVGSRQARIKPQSEWHITPDTHEPLVTKDEFDRAQLCIRSNKSKGVKLGPRVPSPHSLPVPVRCGSCGRAMVKSGAKVQTYYCKSKKMTVSEDCFDGKIENDVLKDILLVSIQRLQETLREQKKASSFKAAVSSVDYVKEIGLLQREIEQQNNEKLTLYNTYSDGEMNRNEYIAKRDLISEKIQTLSAQANLLEQEKLSHKQSMIVLPPAVEYLQDTKEPLQYSNELVSAMVKHIVVYSNARVEITWKHSDEIGTFLQRSLI